MARSCTSGDYVATTVVETAALRAGASASLSAFGDSANAVGLALSSVLLPLNPAHAADSASPDPYANETSEQRDARMQWWREARFGMFIHWGVYSVPAGTYHDQRVGSIG